MAIVGIPKLAASSAAPTVPDVVSSAWPMLKPVFIPEIIRSGFSSIISNNPRVTASVGVPLTPYAMLPSFKILSLTLNGSYNVNACPIPLCWVSGATTTVSHKSSTAFLQA